MLQANVERIASLIDTLARLTEPDRPYTRRALTDLYQRAREWLRSEFEGAGLEVRLVAGSARGAAQRGERVVGERTLVVEPRAMDESRVENFLERTRAYADRVGEDLALDIVANVTSGAAAARSDARIVAALERSCLARSIAYRHMSSSAGHDAMQLATIAPMGMVFIPCVDGVSHDPAESARIEAIAAGAEVIADALAAIDGGV